MIVSVVNIFSPLFIETKNTTSKLHVPIRKRCLQSSHFFSFFLFSFFLSFFFLTFLFSWGGGGGEVRVGGWTDNNRNRVENEMGLFLCAYYY